ncbi:MAG TPA: hypothetical protein VFF52_15345 [Isosphaeraceae bacterium]|nr:hypothetical protein [Isosphaeraceae bacterium]
MPTATDENLAESLANFRVEVAERFGKVEKDLEGFRSGVETELRIIRKLGTWLSGGVFGVVAALVTGAATVGWSASAVVSEVKSQVQRIDKLEGRIDRVEKRLDGIDQKLDILIHRSESKTGG